MILLAATPIGNLQDASPRLVAALASAEVVASEDTRTTVQLLHALGIEHRPRLISMHDHNERDRVEGLLELAERETVVVTSDAGMPTVSDPGYHLVAAARERGIRVSIIPGPSAPLAALAVSGLPTDRFSFEGFVPRKAGERARLFASLARDARTMIFFESPHRLHATLVDMAEAFGGDRPASVCRELTKLHEEVRNGTLDELAEWAADGVRGEIVVVVGPAPASSRAASPGDALALVRERVEAGERLKSACSAVAAETGLRASDLYRLAHEG